ncbi:histidine kinase [Streptomyces sp. DSM 44915]|uniref:histidine kinase n=1 Tax=Streptomyces chisholmiae TaxID=3075540 RepID=A0ABU2K0B4_9ACTN|nr:histidine kinase [Streptomyces sp. DSM 44915]MDT0269903.1 histidine kinase [Streptomyces sp. DSM 44915]
MRPRAGGPGVEEWAAPGGRTSRDWLVDTALCGAAVLLGLVVLGVVRERGEMPRWVAELDPVLGLLACLALWWRRRHALAVALLGVPAVALASSALPAGAVLVANLGLRVRERRAVPVLGLYVLLVTPSGALVSPAGDEAWFDAAFSLTYLLAAFSIGYGLRARRLLVARLRADVAGQRAEHARRLAEARRAERRAIAREMHDVLAHRVSLLSLHAGALAYRSRQAATGVGPSLSGAEVADSAEVIRGNAHAAVGELQEVLGLLRAEGDPAAAGGWQPRISDIGGLLADARAVGQPVELLDGLDHATVGELRAQSHRTGYRVVQEGLTNARKHAPGSPTTVRLAGGPGDGLTVEVRNALPARPAGAGGVPGAGAGLAGLAERVRLDGGTLEYSPAGGTFLLRARLPWPAR